MVISGCATQPPKTNTPNPKNDTNVLVKKPVEIHDGIHEKTQDILDNTKDLETKIPEDVKPKTKDNIERINASAIFIGDKADELLYVVLPAAKVVQTDVNNIAKERDQWKQVAADEKAKNESGIKTFLIWVFGISFMCTLGGIAIAVLTPFKKAGVGLSVLAGLVGAAAIAINKYEKPIGIGFMVVLALFVGYAIYILWQRRNEIFTKQTTNERLVQLGESIKEMLTQYGNTGLEIRRKIFGDGTSNGIAGEILRGESPIHVEVQKIRKNGKVRTAKSIS